MPTPGEWREFQAWQMRERLAVRDALIASKVAAPDPVATMPPNVSLAAIVIWKPPL